jgi:dihydrofolate reductase
MSAPLRIAYIAVSADGFIADRHGQVGWLEQFGSANELGFEDFITSIDALLMGRRTFDQVMSFGGPWPYGSRPSLVLTHRPLPPHAPASARAATADEVTQGLLGAPGRIWIVGGGETLGMCLRRGLVDELQVFQMPILLGEGIGLTGRLNHSTPITLESATPLAHGVLKLTYSVPQPVTLGPAHDATRQSDGDTSLHAGAAAPLAQAAPLAPDGGDGRL